MAGVQVNIAEGAGLTVADGKNIYFYDSDEWSSDNFVWGPCKFKSVAYAPGKAYNRTNKDLVDAKMDVNGSVTAIGAIYTTKGGADICSSNKTGKYVQQGKPGAETETYQYNTNGNNKVTIPITAAQLHNADGSYTKTANAITGKTIPYCTCPTCGGSDGGKWLKDFAAIINGNGEQVKTCATLQAAVNEYTPNSSTAPTNYIKLLHNTTEKTISVNNKNLRLDLNGRTVTGDISVTSGYKLYGMDSSTGKDYVTAPSGKIVGTVTGTVAPTYQTPTVTTPDGDTYDRYVAISVTENGTSTLSFHHFNISVTGYRFELATGGTPQCALFFIGKFRGDDAAKNHLKSLGFTLTDIDGTTNNLSHDIPAVENIPPEGNPGESPVVLSSDGAFLFEAYLIQDINKDDPNTYKGEFSAIAKATFGSSGDPKDNSLSSEERRLSFQQALWDALSAPDMEEKDRKILMNFLNDMNIPNPNP